MTIRKTFRVYLAVHLIRNWILAEFLGSEAVAVVFEQRYTTGVRCSFLAFFVKCIGNGSNALNGSAQVIEEKVSVKGGFLGKTYASG